MSATPIPSVGPLSAADVADLAAGTNTDNWLVRHPYTAARLLAQEVLRLQAFKDWVHQYLDAQGVPHHPPGVHGAEGCRIGDRLDWLMGRLTRLRDGITRLGTVNADPVIGHMIQDLLRE